MTVLIKNRQRLIRINQQEINSRSRKALRLLGLKGTELSILLVNDREMQRLNFTHRGMDKTTDVLSFPQNPPLPPFSTGGQGGITGRDVLLGDIVIN
ncbi:MAG: rRNA maturation RNase YbeY, partial [Nitrospirae bacterium]